MEILFLLNLSSMFFLKKLIYYFFKKTLIKFLFFNNRVDQTDDRTHSKQTEPTPEVYSTKYFS